MALASAEGLSALVAGAAFAVGDGSVESSMTRSGDSVSRLASLPILMVWVAWMAHGWRNPRVRGNIGSPLALAALVDVGIGQAESLPGGTIPIPDRGGRGCSRAPRRPLPPGPRPRRRTTPV